jgi:hypothetical protein
MRAHPLSSLARAWTVACGLALMAAGAHAASTCEAKAADKKLHGAAKNSYVKKCEKDMAGGGSSCEAKAADKKLHGAAKNSYVKKCESDSKSSKDDKPKA